MKRIVQILFFLGTATLCHAQQWDEASFNSPGNIMHESWSPVRFSKNSVTDFSTGVASWNSLSGDFHDADAANSSQKLSIFTEGLKKIGKFHLTGMIGYNNSREKGRIWNSTLWLDKRNPFAIGDTIGCRKTIESFQLQAGATYAISDRLTAGAEVKLDFGTLSDQVDPRPKTHASVIPITAGLEYSLGNDWSLGMSAGVKLYNSGLQYSIVNAQIGYRYFLMKGMGDYLSRSSASETSYTRNYSGTTWSGALNATKKGKTLSNFSELRFASGSDKATDGGSLYKFKGGDHSSTSVEIHDRIQIIPSSSVMHNLTGSFSYSFGKDYWYDQKRDIDPEHGNITYYKVLAKSKVQDFSNWSAQLRYRLDLVKSRFYAEAFAGAEDILTKHYLGSSSPEQEIMSATFSIIAGKYFSLKKATLLVQAGGSFKTPFTSDFQSGTPYSGENDITSGYNLRQFEYDADKMAGVNALADLNMPVSKRMKLGIFAKADWKRCLDFEVLNCFDSESRTAVTTGLYLEF